MRLLLDRFEKEFVERNGRKIKFMHDVKRVQNEYNRYKKLKVVIADLEAQIKAIAKIK